MTPAARGNQKDPGKKIRPFVKAFRKIFRNMPDLQCREFGNQNQFRYYFPQWEYADNRPNDSIFYEMNDWNVYGKAEIRIDIQFWNEYFNEIAEIVRQRKEIIAGKMPLQPTIEWNIANPQWSRLQYCFLDTTDPKVVAECMRVLIEESKEIVNAWLKSKKMRHF